MNQTFTHVHLSAMRTINTHAEIAIHEEQLAQIMYNTLTIGDKYRIDSSGSML